MQLNNVGLILMRRQALRHVVVVATCCSITLLFAIPCLLSEQSSSQLGHATFAFAHAHFPYTVPRMSESCDLENAREHRKNSRERERGVGAAEHVFQANCKRQDL